MDKKNPVRKGTNWTESEKQTLRNIVMDTAGGKVNTNWSKPIMPCA